MANPTLFLPFAMRFHIPPSLLHRRFRLLWGGLALSVIGTRMQFWALLWHIRELTDQPIALGGVGLARIVPIFVFSLIGGVVADMADRRRVMFVTQSVLTLVALTLGWLTLTGEIRLWHIYLLTSIQAVAAAFDLPARQSITPNLVPARDLPNAFSMQSMAFQLGAIIGPALSGILIGYWGLAQVYWVNALSYGAIFYALILMGPVEQQADPAQHRTVSLAAIKEGIQFLRERPIIFSSMLLDFFATFFSSANALMPIFARDILGVGEIGYGWLSAAQSIGA
ncbi:MAG: MFS transporter, partial [Alphaproteobacteria bacterium]|nr:MFS transporter [Alphaproteobacteria bacterium]